VDEIESYRVNNIGVIRPDVFRNRPKAGVIGIRDATVEVQLRANAVD
jgi:hypothetical protein